MPVVSGANAFAPREAPEVGGAKSICKAVSAAYGRLGMAIMTHYADGVKTVWAEDFVVNLPNNTVLRRDEVITAMEQNFLDDMDFHKPVSSSARSLK